MQNMVIVDAPMTVNEKMTELNKDGWRAVSVTCDAPHVCVLLEREAPIPRVRRHITTEGVTTP